MTYNLPVECDTLCDDYHMESVLDTLQIARLEHLVLSGYGENTARLMAEYEREKRREAYNLEDFVRSLLGVLEPVVKNGECSFELQLKLPKAFICAS